MATNLFFNNFGHSGQQNLLEDLIVESIKMYGHDVIYIPRTLVKEDYLFGEDVLSKFTNSYEVEMYIKNVEGFEGEGDFLSKFNVEVRDEITFTVSKRRFGEEVDLGQLIAQEDGDQAVRPHEGDLIYFPLTEGLFEIKFVEDESVFYQMGELQMYDLKCELFEYSHEENTGAYVLEDDVPADVKFRRVNEIMELQSQISWEINQEKVGKAFRCLFDRKEGNYFYGRTEYDSPDVDNDVLVDARKHYIKIGEFVDVEIYEAGDFDLYGTPVLS